MDMENYSKRSNNPLSLNFQFKNRMSMAGKILKYVVAKTIYLLKFGKQTKTHKATDSTTCGNLK
jgi:hypothetical protein